MKKRTFEIFGFLVLEALLFAAFVYYDFRGLTGGTHFTSTGLKFLAIALCFLTMLHWSREGGSRLMAWALGFTLAADVCLLLLGGYAIVGVVCFCVVQALYFCRILRKNGGRTLWWLRLLLFAMGIGLIWYLELFTAFHALIVLYFTTFLCNAIQSFNLRGSGLFIAGLLLYLLCDICIGLCRGPIEISGALWSFAENAIWLFYLPGQVLLVLSGLPGKGK